MTDNDNAREIFLLSFADGNSPFEEWFKIIFDSTARRRILVAIARLADTRFRNFRPVGDGVYELRIFLGPGYRIYFGIQEARFILLIGGGNKDTQNRDIYEAKKYWKAYKIHPERYQRKLLN